MNRSPRLAIECLEERLTPTTSGVAWPDGSHLTLSFVPDGTRVGNFQSNLFATLNQVGSTAAWQQSILRAFETWAAQANLNVGVVADGGQDLGTSGAVQGDSRFGDIRIAAAPLAAGTLITNTQFQWSGTTWSGDVVVNSSYLFSLGGANGTNDLYTCMLNEAANVFGVLDTHTDTASGAYYQYTGVKSGIDANDVADIRSLYGARSADVYDAAGNNGTLATATNLGLTLTGLALQADITTPADVDCYKFTAPIGLLPIVGMTVQLGTSGLSSFVGKLQVFNGSGHLMGTATASDPLHGDLTVQVSGGGLLGLGGLNYYVSVADGNNAAFGVGTYNLNVSFTLANGSILSMLLPDGILNVVGNTLATATQLTSHLLNGQKPDARFDYTAKAHISSGSQTEYFKVQAPTAAGQKMNVLVWALPGSQLLPRVDVYNGSGALVPSVLLANENGTFSVEVTNATSGDWYYVKVSALNPNGSRNTGSYFLGVDFNTDAPTALIAFTAGTLTAAQPQQSGTLTVGKNQLDEFILSASSTSAADVEMDIYDAAGNLVFTLRTTAGLPASTGHVYLKAGIYSVRFTGIPQGNSALPTLAFSFSGRLVSDPIGPRKDTGIAPPPSGTNNATTVGPTVNDQPYYS